MQVSMKGPTETKKRGKAVFNSNKDKLVDNRLSVCGNCNKGIFKNRHSWEWTKNGFLHTECVTDEDKISA